jgi:hypothetical protein
MYRVATYLVDQWWDQPSKLADGIGVLLFSWHQAHYRFGLPDLERLEQLLDGRAKLLLNLRYCDIAEFSNPAQRATQVAELFHDMLEALKIAAGKSAGRKSPVAVAKALHLLAPKFFPIWDEKIARAYDCYYGADPFSAYVKFIGISQQLVIALAPAISALLDGKTSLKLVDEYNYAKFTKKWC